MFVCVTCFSFTLSAAVFLALLRLNWHPARLFVGDTYTYCNAIQPAFPYACVSVKPLLLLLSGVCCMLYAVCVSGFTLNPNNRLVGIVVNPYVL